MVTILSSHLRNSMISTLSVLLTLNKALPGGHSRIAKVSLMVRLIFSLSKFQGSLVFKTGGAVISFPPFCLNTAPGTSTSVGEISQDHHCHTYLRSPTDVSQNIICTNMTREKVRTLELVRHTVVKLTHHCLDPNLLPKRWFVHPISINSL